MYEGRRQTFIVASIDFVLSVASAKAEILLCIARVCRHPSCGYKPNWPIVSSLAMKGREKS